MNNMLKSKIINDLLQEQSINTICMMYGISKQELNNILKDTRMNLYNVDTLLQYHLKVFSPMEFLQSLYPMNLLN